ncbi:conserved hypothetical protein [Ricinus communis]|uniref:Uncharacterized protein n=1 Tax=Ricinus communis TaxID=3988 RepID=B9S7T1_RICCO|nr:conserved hypothetical protein [Ricinus communis]
MLIEGNGNIRRPTPHIATAKNWITKLNGRGLRPESNAIGPLRQDQMKAFDSSRGI